MKYCTCNRRNPKRRRAGRKAWRTRVRKYGKTYRSKAEKKEIAEFDRKQAELRKKEQQAEEDWRAWRSSRPTPSGIESESEEEESRPRQKTDKRGLQRRYRQKSIRKAIDRAREAQEGEYEQGLSLQDLVTRSEMDPGETFYPTPIMRREDERRRNPSHRARTHRRRKPQRTYMPRGLPRTYQSREGREEEERRRKRMRSTLSRLSSYQLNPCGSRHRRRPRRYNPEFNVPTFGSRQKRDWIDEYEVPTLETGKIDWDRFAAEVLPRHQASVRRYNPCDSRYRKRPRRRNSLWGSVKSAAGATGRGALAAGRAASRGAKATKTWYDEGGRKKLISAGRTAARGTGKAFKAVGKVTKVAGQTLQDIGTAPAPDRYNPG